MKFSQIFHRNIEAMDRRALESGEVSAQHELQGSRRRTFIHVRGCQFRLPNNSHRASVTETLLSRRTSTLR